jgi:2-oxoglutarate dehydrogenase complex dehydrogenase (E1) component-like enzyme
MSNDSFDVNKMDERPPNWHIVNCTTPAQYFHVLRRQVNIQIKVVQIDCVHKNSILDAS